MWRAKGMNGTIAFDGRVITISREGVVARSVHGSGERTIQLSSVSSVQWRNAGMAAGQLSIVVTGHDDAAMIRLDRGPRALMKGAKAATNDPNTITFHRHKQADFEKVRDAIEAAMAGDPRVVPQFGPTPAPTVPSPQQAPAPPPPQGPPAGWYQDPDGSGYQRWWDGSTWTEHLQPG